MITVKAALKKLEKLNVNVTHFNHGVTDFYSFTIFGANYEFTNQPIVSDNADGFCMLFDNGSSPSFYNTLNALIKSALRRNQ